MRDGGVILLCLCLFGVWGGTRHKDDFVGLLLKKSIFNNNNSNSISINGRWVGVNYTDQNPKLVSNL